MLQELNLLGFWVTDIGATVGFYKKLGFHLASEDGDTAEVKLGDFRLQFIAKKRAENMEANFQKDAFGEPKGTGIYINVRVGNIDDFYKRLQEMGIRTSSEPRDWPWGQREFVARDPDGYKLVFYEPIK